MVAAQPPEAPKQLLTTLRTQTFEGNLTALRDLGGMLGRSDTRSQAASFLNEACFIFEPEWATAKRDRSAFFNFFYKNKTRFEYDELLDAWLTQPLENQLVNSEIQPIHGLDHPTFLLKKWGKELNSALEKGDSAVIFETLENLVLLENSADFLFSVSKKLSPRQPQHIFAWFAQAIVAAPTDDRVDLILKWAKEKWIAGDQAEYAIEVALNHYIGTDVPEIEAERVRFWRDSLGTLDQIRQHGFESQVNTLPIFFENEVDYWGRVLSLSGNLPWVRRNAVLALCRTHHPRSLYYLASQMMKLREKARFRSFPGTNTGVLRQIEHMTGQKTGVADSLGRTQFAVGDRIWAFNFAAFWAKNYPNFEWDARRQTFVNRFATGSLSEEADRLFRRLSSTNDSVAIDAYRKLTETDPGIVLEKTEQYRQLVRSFNPLLPSFKYKYLEVLVQLTDFCAEEGFDWRTTPKLDSLIEKLAETQPANQRYLIENQAIATLSLADATTLEYAACLRERNLDFNFSASRILDKLYSKHWLEIQNDPAQLRFFLKKAALFSQIGTVGACNFYLQKTGWRAPLPERRTIDGKLDPASNSAQPELDRAFVKALADLEFVETDEDVLSKINQLLNTGGREKLAEISWSRFYEMPESLKINQLAKLPPLGKKDRKLFLKFFEIEKSPARAARHLDYLEQKPDLVWAPDLLKMLDDPRCDSALNVPKRAISILCKTMQIDLGSAPQAVQIAQLKNFKKTLGPDFSVWRERFFEEKMARLRSTDSLSITEINEVLQSSFFQPKFKPTVLSALVRVRPAASIKRLNPLSKLQIPEDLAFFEPISFNYRDLDDLTRLFQTDKPAVLLDFFIKKSTAFDSNDRGIFFNEILRQDWLRTYMNALADPTPEIKKLKTELITHLDSDELSEFEEQATALHLLFLENIGVSYRKKLEATFALNLGARGKGQLQREILAGIPWAEIADVAPLFDKLSPDENGRPAWFFLTTDFGLPPDNFGQNPDNQLFIKLLKEKTQPEVIRFYLEKFGLALPDLSKPEQKDFEKLADLLAFDITTPFVGGGGERRDWFVFGLIKLLENKFGTRLGFHEKLNENQTFYTYNASKRAAAWGKFLREKGFISASSASGKPFIH